MSGPQRICWVCLPLNIAGLAIPPFHAWELIIPAVNIACLLIVRHLDSLQSRAR